MYHAVITGGYIIFYLETGMVHVDGIYAKSILHRFKNKLDECSKDDNNVVICSGRIAYQMYRLYKKLEYEMLGPQRPFYGLPA